jgi:tetratricopeptide (TPR) repeat protein
MGNKDDKFSFEKDPGKLKETSNDLDFTFSDIPVLGVKKETKNAFSFDAIPEESTPLVSTPLNTAQESQETQNNINNLQEQTIPVQTSTSKKKNKILFLIIIIVVLLLGAGVYVFLLYNNNEELPDIAIKKSFKHLTEEEKKELAAKKLKEKVTAIISSAENLYNTKKYKKAEKVYKQAIQLAPTNAKALTGIGFSLKQLKDFENAKKAFSKAISNKAPLEAYIELSTILEQENKYEKKCKVLEKAIKEYPKNIFLSLDLAEAYKNAGDTEKALEIYKNIPKKDMTQDSLMIYAELISITSKEKAIQIYLYLGKKYLTFQAYQKASKLADSPNSKIQIFTQAVEAFSNAPSDIKTTYLENAKYLKLKALMEADEKEEAAEIINNFDYLRLNKEYREELINIAIKVNYPKLEEFVLKFLKLFPNDINLQIKIQDNLIKTQKTAFLLKIYSDYWTEDPNSPLANFLRGKAVRTNPAISKKYYKKAIRLKSDFSQARIELGKIYINEKKWKEAENLFEFSINMDKNNNELHFFYALVSLKNGKGPIAIKHYADFLNNLKLSPAEIALKLLPLAFLLPTPEKTDALLHILEQNSTDKEQYKILVAKRFLIFPSKETDAFNYKNPRGQLREYCILNLLRQGKIRNVLMMPTPKDEFPEFWKVFLARRKNMKTWEPMAKTLLNKHKHDEDITIKIISKLWLGQLTPQAIEEKLSNIPYLQQPLMLFLLADEYKKLNNRPKSTIRYRKALAYGRNIYSDVIKYFMKH